MTAGSNSNSSTDAIFNVFSAGNYSEGTSTVYHAQEDQQEVEGQTPAPSTLPPTTELPDIEGMHDGNLDVNMDNYDAEDNTSRRRVRKVCPNSTPANLHLMPVFQTQQDQLQEFVERVPQLLKALLAREATPVPLTCSVCNKDVKSPWRCKECFVPELLCRGCMRESHNALPYHRIECWSGTCFRPGALWEVGLHLTVPHMGNMCDELKVHKQNVIALEVDHDRGTNGGTSDGTDGGTDGGTYFNPDADREDGDLDDDDLAGEEIPAYSDSDPAWYDDLAGSLHGPSTIPRMDAFRNPFVRVIHVNGVHHLPLITCACQGQEQIPADLVFVGLVPTTFSQFRTLATSEVLDHMRYSNLDLKSSSWQYHRLLRRQTQPLPVHGNMNLYKELRRLSREWRWMKKLKWAGYGHGSFLSESGKDHLSDIGTAGSHVDPAVPGQIATTQENAVIGRTSNGAIYLGDPLNPTAGSLANFCPACPQVGVNLCPDWENDPNQWVYTRFVVLDGNFKADHVRQKADDNDDIWLSNGGGMYAKQEDYQAFIRTARQRRSVCNFVPRIRCTTLLSHLWRD